MILPLVFNRIVANNRIPQRLLSLGNRYAFFSKYWGILYFFSGSINVNFSPVIRANRRSSSTQSPDIPIQ